MHVMCAHLDMASVGERGRPRSLVSKERLKYLRQDLCFSWDEAAAILHTSSKTLQRRAKEWDISKYSVISDAELDDLVNTIAIFKHKRYKKA